MISYTIQCFEDVGITEELIHTAAKLFSENYGIWGPLAAEKMGGMVKQGVRIKMSPQNLKLQILHPSQTITSSSKNIYIRAISDTQLIGNVFATIWTHENSGKVNLWITQLCVHKNHRNQGVATALLVELLLDENDNNNVENVGILSSHPFAIMAVLRVFGRGLESVDASFAREKAENVMRSCPIRYVREAGLSGSVFEGQNKNEKEEEGIVCCADTGFWVDHTEPNDALQIIKEQKRLAWSFRILPEGYEFLALVPVAKD